MTTSHAYNTSIKHIEATHTDPCVRKAHALRIVEEAKKNNDTELARMMQFYADKLHDQIVFNPTAQWLR